MHATKYFTHSLNQLLQVHYSYSAFGEEKGSTDCELSRVLLHSWNHRVREREPGSGPLEAFNMLHCSPQTFLQSRGNPFRVKLLM